MQGPKDLKKPNIEKEEVDMTELVQDKVKQALKRAEGLYYRLVLLVGEAGSGKSTVLHNVATELGVPPGININLELSEKLLGLTVKKRALHLPKLFSEIADTGDSTLVLDNLEIIFDKELKQDPLKLLQGLSRNRSVLASWNGLAEKGKLIYAEPGHPEYRVYNITDTLIVGMNNMATADSTKTREANKK